ncbi:MAG: hypothetical protein RLZZ01_2151 [Actinomycetota bacterium]|jgi:glucose/arabinose dehydrogenase
MTVARTFVAIGAVAAVSACAANGTGPDDASTVSIIVAPTSTSEPARNPSPQSSVVEAQPDDPVSVPTSAAASAPPTGSVTGARVVLVEEARFERPVDLVGRPGDAALYVVQQRGTIARWDRTRGTRTTVLDVTDEISDGGEQGLLGLAFTPDGRHAFVNTTEPTGDTIITVYEVGVDGEFDAASAAVMLIVPQPYGNHNAGDLAVDDEGLLYIALGDGGSAGDPERNAHDPTTLLGSLLRIDPVLDGSGGYRIPDDNPFVDGALGLPDGSTVLGAPEVFAWGLRNPWKFAFDPVTGDLWIPDVGQNEIEEVNMVASTDGRPAGRAHDFGWSAFEGTERFDELVPDTGRTTPPVLTYRHGPDGCSVSGGEPYHGTAVPELVGAFVYSDYCSGRVWALDLAGSLNVVLADGLSEVTAIRADGDGELYVLEAGGRILRIAPAGDVELSDGPP